MNTMIIIQTIDENIKITIIKPKIISNTQNANTDKQQNSDMIHIISCHAISRINFTNQSKITPNYHSDHRPSLSTASQNSMILNSKQINHFWDNIR